MSFTGTGSGEASTNVPEINAIGLKDLVKPLPWAKGNSKFQFLREVNLKINFIMDHETISIFSSLDYVTKDRITRSANQSTGISSITVKQGTVFDKGDGEYVSEYSGSDKSTILANVLGSEKASIVNDKVKDMIISDRSITAQLS